MSAALKIDSVVKRFDNHLAVDHLSMEIPRGVIYGILGPNGAGKTTTIRMVMNIIARDAGNIAVLGRDPFIDSGVLKRIGYLPEERGLYKKMKALDVIVFFGRLKGMTQPAARKAALEWLERMGLSAWAQARVETLSKGMQQKVQFIATVLHEPELLILDEPTSGLDPVNQNVLRDTILNAKAAGRTVIFSTHNMDQAEQLCDSVCIIAGGKKVLDGTLKAVRHAHLSRRYRVEFETAADAAKAQSLLQHAPFANPTQTEERCEFELAGDAKANDALAALAKLTGSISAFARIQPSLHEIFVSYASNAATAPRLVEREHD